ncbi:MAG: hypothetical protein P1T08_13095 [Acidimicrobiia bacterium]|nr:hypothetical protein [Acidimicrobiia bacterium]
MPTFEGSLQIAGDAGTKMPAGIRVDGGRLMILVGTADEIGNWSLAGLDIRRKSGAFVLEVEGEQLLISVDDPEGFTRLVEIKEDAPRSAPKHTARRSRKEKKASPPKEPRGRTSKKAKAAESPTLEPGIATPAAEPKPVPSYLTEPEPMTVAPPPPALEEQPPARRAEQQPAKKKPAAKKGSLIAALPLSWKIGAGVVVIGIILGIFLPGILTALLMLSGMITLLIAVVVGTDSIAAARLPSGMTSTNTLVAGVILLVLSALMMVIS